MNDIFNESDWKNPNPKLGKKGIYLLPNLLTTTGLFFGFFAIVSSLKHHFAFVPWAIFIAMLADSLDGRVARLTNTQTAFGEQYDSLSDVIAFGLTPAIYVYSWGLYKLGKIGWLIAFFYVAATALRLARFNSQLVTPQKADKRYFKGLACTSAAGFVTGVLWLLSVYNLRNESFIILAAAVTAIAGLLMVSGVRYRSFKDSDFKDKVPYLVALIVIILFVLIAFHPPQVLAGIFILYALSGPLFAAFNSLRRKRKRNN